MPVIPTENKERTLFVREDQLQQIKHRQTYKSKHHFVKARNSGTKLT